MDNTWLPFTSRNSTASWRSFAMMPKERDLNLPGSLASMAVGTPSTFDNNRKVSNNCVSSPTSNSEDIFPASNNCLLYRSTTFSVTSCVITYAAATASIMDRIKYGTVIFVLIERRTSGILFMSDNGIL